MDSNPISDQKKVLTYAACEWFLIFLMFIDALLSYLLVWFASYCRLQMPCFLCSKLLHPLHWRFLLCRNHRSEVSSFISCHNHNNNLADCRGMCDDCLLSFTKITGSNPDMNRFLLGKLGYDLLSNSNFTHSRLCSCCNKPWRTRQHTQRLIRLGSRGKNSPSKPNIPAPRHLTRRGSGGIMKRIRDNNNNNKATSGTDLGSHSDGMAHVSYKELKIHSDADSDFFFSDEDAFLQITDFDDVQPSSKRPHKSRSRKSYEDKKMSNRKQPVSRAKTNKDKNIHVTAKSSMSKHKIVDMTRQQQPVEAKKHEVELYELITMSEARPFLLSLPQENNAGISAHSEYEAEASGNSSSSGGEFLNPSEENAASREIQIQEHDDSTDLAQTVKIEATEEAMEPKVSDQTHVPGSDANDSYSDADNGIEGGFKSPTSGDMPKSQVHEQSSEEENENNVAEEYFSNEEDEVNRHSEPSTSNNVSGSYPQEQLSEDKDESNGYSVVKSHSSDEEDVDKRDSEHLASNNVTDSATEEHTGKKEHKDHEECEPLTSLEHSNEESSLEHSNKDSSKVTEAHTTSNKPPDFKHSASVESLTSISSEIEGESLVDLLKQQLEHDRKSLRDLSKELEEERNASAVATNQAMAMITRLQEEKAALHMEALQYLRMMDEQAEHDVDALEKANDILADREKEIQDLEMELEYYRLKYPDEPREEILASMGILENIETTGTSTMDEISDEVPTDTKLTDSPSAEV